MSTKIVLISCNELDLGHNHTPYFTSEIMQLSWFMNKKVLHIDENSYHRTNDNIKIDKEIEEIRQYNYLLVNNGKKNYFYFIINKEYVNQYTTNLLLKLDVIQTYLFEFELKESLVDRMHCNRYYSSGRVMRFYEDEGLEFGEPILYDTTNVWDYSTIYNGCYIITSSDRLGLMLNNDSGSGGDGGDIGGGGGGNTNCGTIPPYPYNDKIPESRNTKFAKVWNGMKSAQCEKIFPSVKYAQFVLESGWDGSTLSNTYNNAFGIKADDRWTGKTVDLPTQEFVDGEWITVIATWRVYDDINESVKDHTQFLIDNPRYAEHGVFNAKTYREQTQCLQNAGYATDPQYSNKLCEIIESNNFVIYDNIPFE